MALDAQGTCFFLNGVEIQEVQSMSGFDGTANEIDVTHLKSTAEEIRMGIERNGSVNLTVFRDYDDLGQQEALAQRAARTASELIIQLPDVGTLNQIRCQVFVLSASLDLGVDATLSGTIQLRITGPVTVEDQTPAP